MHRSDLKEEEYSSLLQKIVPIVMEKGLKSTTMDIVASSLGMSKRTLYEIFGSKSDMLYQVLESIGEENKDVVSRIYNSSGNVMEALIDIFKYNRDRLRSVNVDFFRDMDRLYKDKREAYERHRYHRDETILQMYNRGVEEGMFRPGVDFRIQSRIMAIQMESLKRMEELFPSDISLQQVFDAIIVGFLRSIASEKGMRVLDKLTEELVNPKKNKETITTR